MDLMKLHDRGKGSPRNERQTEVSVFLIKDRRGSGASAGKGSASLSHAGHVTMVMSISSPVTAKRN